MIYNKRNKGKYKQKIVYNNNKNKKTVTKSAEHL